MIFFLVNGWLVNDLISIFLNSRNFSRIFGAMVIWTLKSIGLCRFGALGLWDFVALGLCGFGFEPWLFGFEL